MLSRLWIPLCLVSVVCYSQNLKDSLVHQTDAIDIGMKILHKDPGIRTQNNQEIKTGLKVSAGPIIEYLKATGVAYGAAVNGAFLTDTSRSTNLSSVLLTVKYTQRKQFLLPLQSSIWFPGSRFYLLGDMRFMHYPQDSYGFGGKTLETGVYTVSYKYFRFYEVAYRKVFKNFYAGVGYKLDHHWNIVQIEIDPSFVTDFTKYGYTPRSVSSGFSLNLLYDTRRNSINPVAGGFYANMEFRDNLSALGSDKQWSSLLIDIRKYFRLPHNMILALWSYNVITLRGNPPYLDLPATGGDTYNNTGRGYEQGRFLGKNMVDLEAELRFPITKNGLVGGVLFANAESLSEFSNRFEVVSFACGVGLRLKFNKLSNTNVAIDYGVGKGGSNSFFGNLGEVF
ncbi:MAG: hypothetical protein WDO14_15575 [Bacteroidota bacterium]